MAAAIDPGEISFDERGLAPCVVQDWRTGEVLTLAYMNAEALARTRERGETHFFSRSRGELWHKGESSGNVQRVHALRYDCDADTLVALVEPAGPACHTGERTCFHRELPVELPPVSADGGPATSGHGGPATSGHSGPATSDRATVAALAPHEALPALERTIGERRASPPAGSYTAELLADPGRAGQKVTEEAEEVVRAAAEESDERVGEEAADVLYHLTVLLATRGLELSHAFEELNGRRR